MEPVAQGRTEKSFSYVVRVPSSDGADVMNVDVKIDTCWVLQDVEESGTEQGCLPEAGAGSPGTDAQLECSEQKMLAAMDKHMLSESGLRHRVQELERSERRLLAKVEQLSARVAREQSASLHAREQLRALQGALASRVQEEESTARRQRWRLRRLREQLRRKDEALGRQAAALERCRRTQQRQLGLVREQERVLRGQVQRLERDVRRLCGAAGLLLAQLDAAAPTSPLDVPEAVAAELRVLRARAQRSDREREDAVRRLRERRALERGLREQLEEMRCCVLGLTLADIGLQTRAEELAQQNWRLRAELGAQAAAGCSSLDVLGWAQGDSLSPPGAEALDLCRRPGCHHDAPGRRMASGGQLLEGPCGCAGAGRGPCVGTLGPGTPGELLGDLGRFDLGQVALVEPGVDGQVLLLGQCLDELPLPWDLAQAPLLLVETATLPEPLLPLQLQEPPLEPFQTQEMRSTRPPPASGDAAHPSWGYHRAKSHHASPCQEALHTSSALFPRGPRDTQSEGTRAPALRAVEAEVKARTLGRAEGELGDRCPPGQEGSKHMSLGSGVLIPGGVLERHWASESQATACCPWLPQECPVQPLQGVTSGLQGGPESLSRMGRVEGCKWGLLRGLSSEKEEAVPTAAHSRTQGTRDLGSSGGQLPVGQDQATWRRVQGRDGRPLWFGDAMLLREESPGDRGQGEEERGLQPQVSSLGSGDGYELPGAKAPKGQGARFPAKERGSLWFPGQAAAANLGKATWALGTGRDGWALQIDEFEREVEACFQQLSVLMAATREGDEEGAYPQHASASHGFDAPSAEVAEPREGGRGAGLAEIVALDTSAGLPRLEPERDGVSGDPAKPGGSQLSVPWGALERARGRFHQLLTALRKERSQGIRDNAKLQGDQERGHHDLSDLDKEKPGAATKISRLEQANRALRAERARLQGELDRCLRAVSHLEDCNRRNHGTISELEEENEKLRGRLGHLQRTTSEGVRRARGRTQRVTLEDAELRALISELGFSYKKLMKDIGLGMEDIVRALKGENEHLLRRVCALEQEVGLQMSRDVQHSVAGGQHPQSKTKVARDKVCTADKEVQVPRPSGQPITIACGPPLEEEAGVTAGHTGPALGSEGSRCSDDSSTQPPVWRESGESSALQSHINRAGGPEAWLEKEERRWRAMDQGQALGSLRCDAPDSEAMVTEEDPRLCTQRLRHQVRTLQCQLRDQGSALWEMQAARDELKGKLEELQKEQREARLAVTPLKAKLASLVRKCWERNHLITRLLGLLRRRAPEDPLLAELAQNMVSDAALVEYTATFLSPGAPETKHSLDWDSEGTTARGDQEYLLNSQTDTVLRSPLWAESWPLPEAEWAAQTAWLDSPKEEDSMGQRVLLEKIYGPSR